MNDIFLHNLEIVLHTYYTHTTDIIICGDININYLEPDDKKDQLNNLLGTFNLTATVTFPTRICRDAATLIDNIFVDSSNSYTIEPCPNGLSDHEGLVLTLETFSLLYNDT